MQAGPEIQAGITDTSDPGHFGVRINQAPATPAVDKISSSYAYANALTIAMQHTLRVGYTGQCMNMHRCHGPKFPAVLSFPLPIIREGLSSFNIGLEFS